MIKKYRSLWLCMLVYPLAACGNKVSSEVAEQLFQAVKKGDLNLVQTLVGKSGDTKIDEIRDNENSTLLHYAARSKNLALVKYLVETMKTDVNAPNIDNSTPLLETAESGSLETYKYLISKGANSTAKDDEGYTTLLAAVYGGNLDVVEYLIKNGACIEEKTNYDCTPLHIAAEEGHFDVFKYLVGKGADSTAKHDQSSTLLHCAVGGQNLKIVANLVENKANINAKLDNGATPLHLAAGSDSFEVFKYLVENGANPNAVDNNNATVLHWAAVGKNPAMVQYLVETMKADIKAVNIHNDTPLHIAAQSGSLEIFRYLLSKGADKNTKAAFGYTALHAAIGGNNLPIVKYLVEGQKITTVALPTDDGSTPLHIAALCGHSEVVKYLLSKGADINATNNNGLTPLALAAQSSRAEAVSCLISQGAVCTQQDADSAINYVKNLLKATCNWEANLTTQQIDPVDIQMVAMPINQQGILPVFMRPKLTAFMVQTLIKNKKIDALQQLVAVFCREADSQVCGNATVDRCAQTLKILLHRAGLTGVWRTAKEEAVLAAPEFSKRLEKKENAIKLSAVLCKAANADVKFQWP